MPRMWAWLSAGHLAMFTLMHLHLTVPELEEGEARWICAMVRQNFVVFGWNSEKASVDGMIELRKSVDQGNQLIQSTT